MSYKSSHLIMYLITFIQTYVNNKKNLITDIKKNYRFLFVK